MPAEEAEKQDRPAEPIEIATKLVPLDQLVYCLRKMVGNKKFKIEMRHDVYKIKPDKAIKIEDLMHECRSISLEPEMDLSTTNPAIHGHLGEELIYMEQEADDNTSINA